MRLGWFDWGFPNQISSDSTCWLGRRPAWMGRPYSLDLRERVVRAVVKGGLSRHQAAAQFGVAISTAINWVRRFRETGSVEPDQVGGYRPKKIAGPHRDWLLQRCASAWAAARDSARGRGLRSRVYGPLV